MVRSAFNDLSLVLEAVSPQAHDAIVRLQNYIEAPLTAEELRVLGGELGEACFTLSHSESLQVRLNELANGQFVRLRLSTATPGIPYEFAHFLDRFPLALHPQIRLVREVPGRAPVQPVVAVRAEQQLRVLLVGANPASSAFPYLTQVEAELASVEAALTGTPECRQTIQLATLPHATPASLVRTVRELSPHVIHIVGHGTARPSGIALVLEGEQVGRETLLYAEELVRLLTQHPLRLLVLSVCGTPSLAEHLATNLIALGTQSVLAMQLPLRDSTARLFARAFYSSLASHESLEESVWLARQALQGAGADWGGPALFCSTAALDATLTPDATNVAPSPTPKHNLPTDERPFVGREEALTNLPTVFRVRQGRLVTITGIGGMGKTTLSIQVGRKLLEDFPDGVWFVECDALSGRSELISAIAFVLGIPAPQDGLTESILIKALTKKRLLLLLDCFEAHVAHATLIDALLKHVPGIAFLVTSRVLLGLTREIEYALDPMALPDESPKPYKIPIESTELFRDAAHRANRGFSITSENRAAVEHICRQLEGVPLALILAAGRLRYLSVTELLDQIQKRPLAVLRRRDVGGDRHAALQDVIESSFRLLDEPEQLLLMQLSIFVGGFTIDDLLAVCSLDGDLLESLWTLRDHSLISVSERSGKKRYRLLDTVREFSGQVGDQRPALMDAARRRHLRHYLLLANELHKKVRSSERGDLNQLVTQDLGNLRYAMDQAISSDDSEAILEFTRTLAGLLGELGLWPEFRKLTGAAISLPELQRQPQTLIHLLSRRAQLARREGDEAEAQLLLERLIALGRQQQDNYLIADSLFELANQARDMADLKSAETLLMDCVQICQTHKFEGLHTNALALLSVLLFESGATSRAEQASAEAEARVLASDDAGTVIYSGIMLGRIYRKWGRLDASRHLLGMAISSGLVAGNFIAVAKCLLELATVAELDTDMETAALALIAADRLTATTSAEYQKPFRAALSRFRRAYGSQSEVQQSFQLSRRRSGKDLAAQIVGRKYSHVLDHME